jgi:hypothetical protein
MHMLELRLKRNRVPNFEVSVEELRCYDALETAQLNQETRKEPMHIRYADKTAMQEPKLPARTALGVCPILQTVTIFRACCYRVSSLSSP